MKYMNEDGEYHRVNGPAIEFSDGDYMWCYHDQYHRYYGVARRWYGEEDYWIFDKSIK